MATEAVRDLSDRCPRCGSGDGLVEAPGRQGHEHYRRASGEMRCERCQKPYRKHPHAEYRDFQGAPWLRRLCSGELVKL